MNRCRLQPRRGGISRAAIATLGVVVLLEAGCAGSDVARGGGSTAGPVEHQLTDAQFNYLAGAGLFSSDQAFLFTAEQRLRQECMSRKGLRYYPARQAQLPAAVVANNVLTATGKPPSEAAQLAQRERNGYGINGDAAGSTVGGPPPNDVYVRSMSAAEQARYMAALEGDGVPGGGCFARVDQAIYGGTQVVNGIIDTPQRIRADVLVATRADPLVVRKLTAWSDCFLRRTGKRFSVPDAVPKWLGAQRPNPGSRTLEMRLAIADTKCGYSVGLPQAFSARFRWHADHLSDANRGALLSTFEIRQRAVTRARRLLHLGDG